MRAICSAFIAVAALLASGAAGCGGGGTSDRAGGTQRALTIVLTLANRQAGADVREWIDAAERLSHRSLRIVVRDDGPRSATETIADVRAGKVDLASIPARAYDTLGVKSLQALLAPFLVDSHALERNVLASGLADRMLAGVKPLGVVGIALLPGGLDKLLSVDTPMLAPSDYRAHPGLPLAIHPSELAASTFRALGSGVSAGADTGRVAGIVQDLVELVAKGYQALTFDETLASNVSFWPRVTSIVINDKAYAALSPAQRNALRNAGRAALGPAMQRVVRDERAALDVICSPPRQLEASFALLTASRSDRAALRDAAQPVYRELERDHATRDVIASIEAIKKHVTAEAAPRCPGSRLRRAPAPVRTLTITGDLTATDHTGWKGAVTSTGLGRGRLVLEGHLLFREFVTVRRMKLTARFRRGELHGCVYVATFDTRHGTFDWDGPGVIARASRPLRNYIGLSFRVAGVTPAGDLRHMRGGFVTDAPSGLPCRRGI